LSGPDSFICHEGWSTTNPAIFAGRFQPGAVGNPREFTQGDKEEQEIAESCNRLIKNSIICRNYLYLSQKLERIDNPEQKDKLLSAISSHSPMSWAHTNLLGEYDFSDEKLKDTAGIRLPKNCNIINTNKRGRQNH